MSLHRPLIAALCALALLPATAFAQNDEAVRPKCETAQPWNLQYVVRGQSITVQIKCTDPQGDPLTYEITQWGGGTGFVTADGWLTWTPGPTSNNEPEVMLTVRDPAGHEAYPFAPIFVVEPKVVPPPVSDTPVTSPPAQETPPPAADTRAPAASLAGVPKRVSLRKARASALAFGRVTVDEAATVKATLRLRKRTLANTTLHAAATKPAALRLKLARAAKGNATLTLVVTDAAGNAATVTRSLTIR